MYHKNIHLEETASGKCTTMTKIITLIPPQFLAQYIMTCHIGVIWQYQQLLHHCVPHLGQQIYNASARVRC